MINCMISNEESRMNIELNETTLKRLEEHATGFGDTPDAVINRLLDKVEGTEKKTEITFYPNEKEFKDCLVKEKEAEVVLTKNDGTIEVHKWNAKRFTENSSLRGNIHSGYLRNKEEKGIVKAHFSKYEVPSYRELTKHEVDVLKVYSTLFHVPFHRLAELDFETENETNYLTLTFSRGQDLDFLKGNPFFDERDGSLTIHQSQTDYPLS